MAAYRCSQRVTARCRTCDGDARDFWCDEDDGDDGGEDEDDMGGECVTGDGKRQRVDGARDVAVDAVDVRRGGDDGARVRAVQRLADVLVSPPVDTNKFVAIDAPSAPRAKRAAVQRVRARRVPVVKSSRRAAQGQRGAVNEFAFEDEIGAKIDAVSEDVDDSLGETGDENDDVVRRVARRRLRRELVMP